MMVCNAMGDVLDYSMMVGCRTGELVAGERNNNAVITSQLQHEPTKIQSRESRGRRASDRTRVSTEIADSLLL